MQRPRRPPVAGPLKIRIPSVTSQFRIEKCAPLDLGIGTKVIVYVEPPRLLPEDVKGLEITTYLKAIAGFVEFPILITEDNRNTVVLHPNSSIDSADPRLQGYPDIEWHRTSLDHPIEQVMLPHYVKPARLELAEVAFDLTDDLSLPDYEGQIVYLAPRNENCRLRYSSGTSSTSGSAFVD